MIIEQIKEAIRIEDLIAQTHTVTGRGPTLTTTAHDSLKIFTRTNSWYWYSRGIGGDVLDWYQTQHGCDLGTAIDELARMAGIERRPPTPAELAARQEMDAIRQIYDIAAAYYHAQMSSPAGQRARAYCTARGWTAETIARHTLGYSGDNKRLSPEDEITSLYKQLLAAGHINHPLAKAVLSIPPDSLIYVHRQRGRITYLSARGIDQKRHYNLPVDLAGQKQPFVAEPVTAVTDDLILVEGQADALSLAQVGLRAIALCGLTPGDLDLSGVSHVAFDTDQPGQTKALDVALAIDPTVRIVQWTAGKDANECLCAGYGIDQFCGDLDMARPAIHHLAAEARNAKGDKRAELIRRFFQYYADLDEIIATDWKPDLAAQLCGGVQQFNRLHKAQQKQAEDGEHASPERYEYAAAGVAGGRIWEQLVVANDDGTRRSLYAIRTPDGAIKYATSVEVGNITYLPFPADLGVVRADVVLFPDSVDDIGTQAQLVRDIQKFIHKYLDIDPFYERLAAYYVMFTWMYDAFENLPYLRALGDYGTGKTRFLQTIGIICYRPMFVSGASTVSPIFRLIDMFRGTLIIDEADFGNSDAEAEIIKIFNVGYYRGGVVLRSEADPESKGDKYSPATYDVYGPKMLATRRPFTDRATESRCLTKRMTTARPRPGIPYTLGEEFRREARRLRNRLLRYRLENHRPIDIDQALADESVEPRLNQVTMALKTIVDSDEMRADIDTFIRAYNENLIADRQMTLPALIVQALAETHFNKRTNVLGEDARDFTLKGLADTAQKIVAELDPDTRVTAKRVATILSEELGMPRRGVCNRTRRAVVLYEEPELKALMARYGIQPPVQEAQ